jgi:2-polyprenyl-6-methoxyphenol hydroxylase-like FAD-dependent oxidoreductase
VLPIGDALCAFDPVFGQGMTVAAQEAVALGRLLAARRGWRRAPTLRLHQAYLQRAARIVDRPWTVVSGEALRLPHLAAKRPLAVRLLHRYGERVAALSAHDPAVAAAFLRVMHLQDGPLSLLRPSLSWRVLRGARPQSEEDVATSEARPGAPRRTAAVSSRPPRPSASSRSRAA